MQPRLKPPHILPHLRVDVREEALLDAHDEDPVELEALGRVDRHELHLRQKRGRLRSEEAGLREEEDGVQGGVQLEAPLREPEGASAGGKHAGVRTASLR